MAQKKKRTFKQLSEAEKQMARTLMLEAHAMGEETGYSVYDVAKALKVSSRTLGALKANMTMAERR
jgi:hypothetical protein